MINLKKTLPILLLPLAYNVNATDVTVPMSFETLPVITVVEETAMDFGPVLSLAQAATCTLSASSGSVITASDDGTAATTPAGGDLTAGTCSGGTAQPGVYTITSIASTDIQVSVTAAAPGASIGFAPIGVVINHNGDTRDAIDGSTSPVVESSAALNAFTAAGTNRVIMGGTITNQAPLTSGGSYSADFDITVVYQ